MKRAEYERMMEIYNSEEKKDLIHELMAYHNIEVDDRAFANEVLASSKASDINEIFSQYKDLKEKFTYAKASKFYEAIEKANDAWAYILSGLSAMHNPGRADTFRSNLEQEISEVLQEEEN